VEREYKPSVSRPGFTGIAFRLLDPGQCQALARLAAAAWNLAGPLPADLLGLRGSQARLPHHFDPNDLLPLFPAVSLDRDHRLDTLYWHDGRRVRALVYVRRRWGGPVFRKGEQYQLVLGTDGLPRLHHLYPARTPAGVMQCLLLHEVLGTLHHAPDHGPGGRLLLDPGAGPGPGVPAPCVWLGERGAVVQVPRWSRRHGLRELEYAVDFGGGCHLLSERPLGPEP